MVHTTQDDEFSKQDKSSSDRNLRLHKSIQTDQQLINDYDTPFSEPLKHSDSLPLDHQSLDSQTGIDSHEIYDEGLDNAAIDNSATTNDPTASDVVDYPD